MSRLEELHLTILSVETLPTTFRDLTCLEHLSIRWGSLSAKNDGLDQEETILGASVPNPNKGGGWPKKGHLNI